MSARKEPSAVAPRQARTVRLRTQPERTCVVCRRLQPKLDLVRVVHTPPGTVTIDHTGRASGRGAYLCRTRPCWTSATLPGQLNAALRITVSTENLEQLRAAAPSSIEGGRTA